MVDVVYIVGFGSQWKNNELRYSLRSVERNLKNFRNVYIVGEKPAFVTGVKHIQFPDMENIPSKNTYKKILQACKDEQLSQRFLLMNDDFFFNKKVEADTYPYYYRGTIENYLEKRSSKERKLQASPYIQTMEATLQQLRYKGLSTLHFGIHTPVILDKILFPKICSGFDWRYNNGLSTRSIYCNSLNIVPVEKTDCKINHKVSYHDLQRITANQEVFSIGDNAIGMPMNRFMEDLFPDPSRFEVGKP